MKDGHEPPYLQMFAAPGGMEKVNLGRVRMAAECGKTIGRERRYAKTISSGTGLGFSENSVHEQASIAVNEYPKWKHSGAAARWSGSPLE